MTVTAATGRDLWRRRVAATPERPFLRFEERSWPFGELDEEALRIAAGLREIGVDRGTRVLVGMPNRPETLMVQLALQELGAVHVPLLPGLTFAELEYPVTHSEASVLVAGGAVAAEVFPRLDRCPAVTRVVVTDETPAPLEVEPVRLADLAARDPLSPAASSDGDPRALAMILYTSGSTGRPKGVMIPAASAAAVGPAFADRYRITGADNVFLATPQAHAVGALTVPGIAIHTGCPLTLLDRFSPSAFWDQTGAAGATVGILFPAHLNLLLEADDGAPGHGESPIRLVVTHAYLQRFRERFGIELATVWGMTETGAICAGSEPGYRGELGENYVGTAMVGSEVAIFDERFARLPPGEPGEICLRHPAVMLGYLKAPEETARTLVDGWIRSGDRGVVDGDGRIFFAGRFKNMIKRSGENISAEEVEVALAAHPAVSECAVFGVPDPIRVEEVAAVVVVRSGAQLDEASLRAASADRLARWKLPRYVLLRAEPLPRLANGKIDRVALVEPFDVTKVWDVERGAPV